MTTFDKREEGFEKKFAHDEETKGISPGTVLTAMMVRRLLERERLTELDFGRGDDPYKALWVSRRRQRLGLVIAAPWGRTGITLIARHLLGRARNLLLAASNCGTRSAPYNPAPGLIQQISRA